MHEGNKATFAKLSLKGKNLLTNNSQNIDTDTVVIDGGWLLQQCTWGKGDKRRDIIDKYCTRVKYLGRSANNAVVVFDGYENSNKDHIHRRHQKQFCHDIKIREDMIPYTTKKSFFWIVQIRVQWGPWYQQNLVFPTLAAFTVGMMQTQQLWKKVSNIPC